MCIYIIPYEYIIYYTISLHRYMATNIYTIGAFSQLKAPKRPWFSGLNPLSF